MLYCGVETSGGSDPREKRYDMAHFQLTDLIRPQTEACVCGRVHAAGISNVIIESGAIRRVPEVVRSYGATKVFVIADGCLLQYGVPV